MVNHRYNSQWEEFHCIDPEYEKSKGRKHRQQKAGNRNQPKGQMSSAPSFCLLQERKTWCFWSKAASETTDNMVNRYSIEGGGGKLSVLFWKNEVQNCSFSPGALNNQGLSPQRMRTHHSASMQRPDGEKILLFLIRNKFCGPGCNHLSHHCMLMLMRRFCAVMMNSGSQEVFILVWLYFNFGGQGQSCHGSFSQIHWILVLQL